MKKFGLNLFNKEINSHEETKPLLLPLINNSFKTFLISLLSLTLLFSISCSNEGSMGGGGGSSINTTYAGDWYDSSDDTKVMTVNSDGSITIDDAGNITNITKKSDTNFIMYYDTKSNNVSVRIEYNINFSSYNAGTIVVTTTSSGITSPPSTINIVKK